MKVLIAGATGLIGTELSKHCKEKNIIVHYLTTSKNKIKSEKNYKGFYWDPDANKIDTAAFDEVTAVINLAGATISKRWSKSYKDQILTNRTNTANILFETLQKIDHQVSHYIGASGISIYPNSKTTLYNEESKEVDNTFLAEVVVAWEAAADQFKSIGLRVAKVRTGVVFAEEGSTLQKIAGPIKNNLGAPLGSGEQWLSWIHIKDIAGIYYHILKHGLEGIYNAVAPNPVTNKKLTFSVAEVLEKNLWLPNVPAFVLKLMLGEMSILVLEGQIVHSKKIEKSGYDFLFPVIEKTIVNLA